MENKVQISIEPWIRHNHKVLQLIGWSDPIFGAKQFVDFDEDAIDKFLRECNISIHDIHWLIDIEGDQCLFIFHSAKELISEINNLTDNTIFWEDWKE